MFKPLELGAMFPFLPEAKEAVRQYNVSLEDLTRGKPFGAARVRGRERVEMALEGKLPADAPVGGRDEDLVMEILSYLYGRILVSAVNDPYLTNKFCLAEAKLLDSRLNRVAADEQRASPGQAMGPIVRRIVESIGVPLSESPDGALTLHFSDYLRFASALDQKDWALAISDLRAGKVFLDPEDAFRLLQEAYRLSLLDELPLPLSESVFADVSEPADRLASLVATVRAQFEGPEGVLDEKAFPPCIVHLLEMTGKGQNVPHMGRFTLVAFLHTIGYDKEGMISLFSRWPDFNIQKSMYQIQHIIGETSPTEYTPPTCATMKTYGICYNPDRLCNYIRHPLSYYRVKVRDSLKMAERVGGSPGGEPGGDKDGDGKDLPVSE